MSSLTIILTALGFAILLAAWTYCEWESWDEARRDMRLWERTHRAYLEAFDLDGKDLA